MSDYRGQKIISSANRLQHAIYTVIFSYVVQGRIRLAVTNPVTVESLNLSTVLRYLISGDSKILAIYKGADSATAQLASTT